jgi:hypothetical protein
MDVITTTFMFEIDLEMMIESECDVETGVSCDKESWERFLEFMLHSGQEDGKWRDLDVFIMRQT